MTPLIRKTKSGLAALLRQSQATRADHLWLRWGLLCLAVLACTMALLLAGLFEGPDVAQLHLLCGNPFFLEAEAAQLSLLSPAATFGLCIPLTFYLGLVLLRQRHFGSRTQITFLAAVAAALPGLLCVLWGSVLYVSPFLFCILACWLLVVLIPFFRRARP